ncbi:MAG: SPOR domain-containing protein [Pseudomonadota bacterium]
MNPVAKTVFALLVLANVGLALWATGFRPVDAPPEGSRPALHPDKMRLVDESGAQLSARNARPAAAGKTEASGCYRIGPFAESAQADKASAVLKGIPLAYERRAEEQTVVTGYRVYLPPLPTRDAAEKKRRELSRLGFKDSSVMQEAGMENALSLGLFTVEANAQKRMQALAAKKIETRMQTLSQARTLHWLYLGAVESPAGVLPRLRAADWGDAEAKTEETPCQPPPAAPVPSG